MTEPGPAAPGGAPPHEPLPILVPPSRERVRKVAPTPEQIAKAATAKVKSPVGLSDKAGIALRLVLQRAVLERLSARAIRQEREARGRGGGRVGSGAERLLVIRPAQWRLHQ